VKGSEIVIVTPALADANNGNWQTAWRWLRFLSAHYRVRIAESWQRGDELAMVALHARRSAPSVAAWRKAYPKRPLVVVLTGTDLYRDIDIDASARQSLEMADRLLVLNELGREPLPRRWRDKASVCLQSSPSRRTLPKTRRHLRALMVGHLREEKSPQTYFEAAPRSIPHSAARRSRSRPGARRTAGSAPCRTMQPAPASRPPMSWCIRAGSKAARTSSSRR
jgi:hypothetical protein